MTTFAKCTNCGKFKLSSVNGVLEPGQTSLRPEDMCVCEQKAKRFQDERVVAKIAEKYVMAWRMKKRFTDKEEQHILDFAAWLDEFMKEG